MLTPAKLRELALALPEAREKTHFRTPDFRVRDKIFAGMSEDEQVGYVKLTPELQTGLLDARPDAFYPAKGAWGAKGWTHFHLNKLDPGELQELLREAWRLVAPKQLLKQESGHGSTPAPAARTTARRSAKEKAAARGRRRSV